MRGLPPPSRGIRLGHDLKNWRANARRCRPAPGRVLEQQPGRRASTALTQVVHRRGSTARKDHDGVRFVDVGGREVDGTVALARLRIERRKAHGQFLGLFAGERRQGLSRLLVSPSGERAVCQSIHVSRPTAPGEERRARGAEYRDRRGHPGGWVGPTDGGDYRDCVVHGAGVRGVEVFREVLG